MEFIINGTPINAKGANWIPIDAMPGRECETRYRTLLQSAVDANMNMIRVWGVGSMRVKPSMTCVMNWGC